MVTDETLPHPPLQRDIGQRKPVRSAAHEAGVGLLKTADVHQRRFAETLKPHGLTPTQYNVLWILRDAGVDGLCTLAVGARMLRQTPGISRMMDRLEEKNWIRRVRSTDDRREVRCHLTRGGKRLVDSLDTVVDTVDARAIGTLSKAEQRRLIELLDKVQAGYA